jgi:sodium-dependent dicarboxylate transporter 2/3/5
MNLNRVIVGILIAGYILCGIFGAFSALGMEKPTQVAFVILLVGATLWITEAVPLFVTSLIILFLGKVWLLDVMQESGTKIPDSVLLAPFFSNIILLFLGGFVLSSALHKYRIDEDLAQKIISKTGHSIPLLIGGIMAITAFLSMWLSNTATAAMMLALCVPIANKLPVDDRYRKAIVLSIPFAANVGGLGTPIGSPPNAIAIQYMQDSGIAPSFGKWMLLAMPTVAIMLIILWSILMLFYRGTSRNIEIEKKSYESVYTPKAVFVLVITLLTVAGWITGPLHGQSSGTVALIPVMILFGLGFLNVKDLRSLSWDILLLMGGGLCLGTIISTGGLADWLITRLPLQDMSLYMIALIFGIVACTMSSLMSNTATANLIMPIVMGLSVTNISPLLVGVAFSCSLAMTLPISTPPNALAFSTEQFNVKEMLKPGLLGTLIGLLLTFTAGWWWWKIIGFN